MKLDHLRAFIAVMEHGSLSEAARSLGRDQPGVTRLIQALESEMGGDLLDRSTKPARPTARGLALHEPARKALDAIAEIETLTRTRHRVERTPLRVGVSHATIRLLAHCEVSTWMKANSSLELQVETGRSLDLVERLRCRQLDAVVGPYASEWTPPDPLQGRCFGHDELLLVAPREMELPRKVTLRSLTSVPWILNPELSDIQRSVKRAFAAQGLALRPTIEVAGDFGALMDFVVLGYGVTLVPRLLVESHNSIGRVQVRPLDEASMMLSIWLCWRELSKAAAQLLGGFDTALEQCLADSLQAPLAANAANTVPSLSPELCRSTQVGAMTAARD